MTAPHERPSPGPAAGLAARMGALLPVADTARLRLRAPRLEDFGAFAAIQGDPVRGRGIGGPQPREDCFRDFAAMVGTWLLRGHGLWAVESCGTGGLLGFVQIGFEPGDLEPELGYFFTAEAEGKGHAAEAVELAREIGFGPLGLATMVSYIDPENARSIALAERVGACREPGPDPETLVYRHSPEGRA